mgnify:CR=1 FL=1
MLLFLNTYSKKFNGLYQMIKSAKNIGFIFVLISITVLTGRFFLNSKNNFINTERTNIEIRTIYEKLKPLLDKAKLASDQGDNLKVINILKQINQKINILNESELQKNIYRGKNLNAIAQNYQAIAYFKEAEDYYLKAAKVYLDIPFKENSQYVLENYLYLSNLYAEIEDYDRGIATLLIANNLIEEQIGKKIPESYIIAGEIGELYLDKGGKFIQTNIQSIEQSSINETTIKTEKEVYKFEKSVIASGAFSKILTDQLGENIPLDTERGYHVHFKDKDHLISRPVIFLDRGFGMTPMNQGLRAVGTVELGGLNNPPSSKRIDYIIKCAKELLPQLNKHEDEWLGFRPTLPDFLPILGPSLKNKNIIYAFGHQHLGWTLGAITGKIISGIVAGEKTNLDLTPYSSKRFN